MPSLRLIAPIVLLAVACGTSQHSAVTDTSDSDTLNVQPPASNGMNTTSVGNTSTPNGAVSTSPTAGAVSSTSPTQTTSDESASDPSTDASETPTGTSDTATSPTSTNEAPADNDAGTVDTSEETTDDVAPQPTGTPFEEQLAPVPTPRGEHGVGALNGEVYVLGGFTPTVTASVQVYTPDSNTWRDAADFPVVFHHSNIATVANRLYVLGFHAGSGQRKADGSAYAYDPEANSWTQLTSMPPGTERGASCVTTYQDKVYVFGGTNDVALPDASAYDPATDEWETLPFVPAMRHHCIAASLNDKIYIVSGRDVVIEEVQPESYVFDPVTKTYEQAAPILTPRGGAAGGLMGGRIYVFGGEGNDDDPRGIFHAAEAYDPASDTWSTLPDMNVPRHGLGGAVIGDRIYLPAGSLSQGIDVTDTFTMFYLN